jgi:hypothetical protein
MRFGTDKQTKVLVTKAMKRLTTYELSVLLQFLSWKRGH